MNPRRAVNMLPLVYWNDQIGGTLTQLKFQLYGCKNATPLLSADIKNRLVQGV